MTDDQELSFILDRWLADGPTEMPDRVIEQTASRIARQRQRPAWRLDWRHNRMTTTYKLAATIAAIAIVAVVGYNLLPGGSIGVGNPAPSPSLTDAPPSPSPSSAVYTWPGSLEAGTYTTSLIWRLPFAVVFTVPDGWDAYDIEISKPGSHGLSVEFVLVDNVFEDPCRGTPSQPSVGPSVDELASAVSTVPGLDVTGPTPTDFDRSTSGAYLEYVVREDAGCAPSAFLLWDMPLESMLPGKPSGGDTKPATYGEGRIWILDVDGVRFVVRATWDRGVTQAERDELQGIVDSVRFSRPGETPPPQPSTN